MDKSQIHNELIADMIAKSGDELRALGESGLADGTEVINPERFISGAYRFAQKKETNRTSRKAKNKQQSQSRKKNRK